MRNLIVCSLILILMAPVPLWAAQPKILAHIPDLEQKVLQNLTPDQVQTLLLKSILRQANINSVQDYASYLEKQMNYKADTKDIWEAPLKTLARGFGDCEDLSFLTAAVLEHFGYEPRVVGFKEPDRSHVFVIVELEDGFYIFDNTKRVKSKIKTLEGLAEYLYTKHHIEFLVEVERTPRAVRMLYTKAQLQQLARN